MNSLSKIAFIIPYFGNFPNYFQYWLKSAEYNKTIDFIIFTNNKIETNSSNIIVHNISFEEIRNKIQSKFSFKIILDDAYKLSAFKPAYGYIFQEYIRDYDFWGFCDIDLILGDIRNYITEDILNEHEKILSHGHMTILRNNEKINKLFMKKRSDCIYYKDVYSSTVKWNNFDEYPYGFSRIAKKEDIKVYEAPIFADLDTFFYTFRKIYSYLDKEDDAESVVQYFQWSNGKLYDIIYDDKAKKWNKNELLYVHFQKRKLESNHLNASDEFYILPNFITNNNLDSKDILKICDIDKNEKYCSDIIEKIKVNKEVNNFFLKILNFQLWKRKIFYMKMNKIYHILPYKFSKGGFNK